MYPEERPLAIDLVSIVDYHFQKSKEGKRWTMSMGWYEKRLWVVQNLLSMGRGGEGRFLQYRNIKWDDYFKAPYCSWLQKKQNMLKYLAFCCNFETYKLDFFHAYACYFIMEGGADHKGPDINTKG